jgi:uncharacterized protein (TIGR02118 family)
MGVWSDPEPEVLEEFARHYHEVHVALGLRVPELEGITFVGNTELGEGGWFGSADMVFADREAALRSMASDEWKELAADTALMIERFRVSVKLVIGDEEVAPLPDGA